MNFQWCRFYGAAKRMPDVASSLEISMKQRYISRLRSPSAKCERSPKEVSGHHTLSSQMGSSDSSTAGSLS